MRRTVYLAASVALFVTGAVAACSPAALPEKHGVSPLRAISQLPAPSALPAGSPPRSAEGRLPRGPKPEGYKLRFELFPDKAEFTGETRISVRVETASPFVVLHGKGLSIDSVSARQGTRSVRGVAEVTDAAQGELALRFESALDPGFAELVLTYHARFSDDLEGLYRVREGSMNAVFTQFEPTSARRAFPCFDEPALKAPYDIEILTSSNDTAVANGREVSREETKNGVLFRFERTPPLPSYLVAVAAGPFDVTEATSSPGGPAVRTIALRGRTKDAAYANEAAVRLIASAAQYTGIPYAYGKLDLVAVPNFNAGAMENPGLVTFREERLLLRNPSLRTKYGAESIIAHEFAHQWFGDYVTAKWWDEVWLNEAFATWLSAKLLDMRQPADFKAIRDAKVTAAWVMDDDSMPSSHAIRAPITSAGSAMEAFDGITYDKGAAILRMLEADVGAANFQNGLHRYLATHPHGAAGFEDLWAAIVHEAPEPVRPLEKARFQAYLDRPGVPDIDIHWRCEAGHPRVQMTQQAYAPIGSPKSTETFKPWNVPVCFEQKEQVQCIDSKEASSEATLSELSCVKPLVPNARLEGYYRFSVSEDALPLLARSDIPETRMATLLNVWAHTKSGRYTPKVLLSTLALYAGEKDPQVVSVLAKVLAKVGDALVTTAARKAYATFVTKTLASSLRRLPLAGSDLGAHVAQARRDAWTTLFDHGTPSIFDEKLVRDRAQLALAEEVTKSSTRDRDADELAIELAARRGDEAYFSLLSQRLSNPADSQERVIVVRALASFDDENLLGRSLNLALDGTIKLQDLRYLIAMSVQRPASREFALTWFDRHWDPWIQKLPNYQAARAVGIMYATCGSPSKSGLAKKIDAALPTFTGWGRTYRNGVEAAKICEAFRESASSAMEAALAGKR